MSMSFSNYELDKLSEGYSQYKRMLIDQNKLTPELENDINKLLVKLENLKQADLSSLSASICIRALRDIVEYEFGDNDHHIDDVRYVKYSHLMQCLDDIEFYILPKKFIKNVDFTFYTALNEVGSHL